MKSIKTIAKKKDEVEPQEEALAKGTCTYMKQGKNCWLNENV